MTQPVLVAVLCGVAVLVCAAGVPAAEEVRGVYMELHSNQRFGTLPLLPDRDWRRLCRELKGFGVNAVFPQVVSP